jgi:hypothetical protein
LPARARPDPFDDGRFERWQSASFDARAETTAHRGLENQDTLTTARVCGLMIASMPRSRPKPGNRSGCWRGGRSVGVSMVNTLAGAHRAVVRPQAVELEITRSFAGADQQITFRVLNNVDVFGASGFTSACSSTA